MNLVKSTPIGPGQDNDTLVFLRNNAAVFGLGHDESSIGWKIVRGYPCVHMWELSDPVRLLEPIEIRPKKGCQQWIRY